MCWRQELKQDRWLRSNLYTSSPVLYGEKYALALQQVVTSPEEARQLVKSYQRAGFDLIKAYGYLDARVFEAIVDEAKKLSMPVAKHGPNPVAGLALELNHGLQSLEHAEGIFQGRLNYKFDREALVQWNKKEAAFLLEIVKEFDDQGIKLLVGSDAGTL